MYTTWANTEKVGWVRLAFDRWEIPFDLIHKDHVQAGANLRAKYHVIVMPHQANNGKSIVYEQPKLSKPLPYKKNDKFKSMGMYAETDDVRGGMGLAGAAEFQKFVEEGGVLMTLGVASYFPADFGIAKGVDAQNPAPGFYAPGPYVNSEILIPTHPVMFGYTQKTLPVRYAGGPLLQAGPPAGLRAIRRHVARSPAGDRALHRWRSRRAERPDAQPRSDPQPADGRRRAVRQRPRDPVRQQPDLPLADLRRTRDGLQFAAVLERHARGSRDGEAGDDVRAVERRSARRAACVRRAYFGNCLARPCFCISLTASFTTSVTTFAPSFGFSVSLSPAHISVFFGTLKISVSSEMMRWSRT